VNQIIKGIVLGCALMCATITTATAETGGVAAISKIYKAYVAVKPGSDDKLPNQLDPKLYSARVKTLLKALDKACAKKDDICYPDFDFLIDGQDFEIKDLKVTSLASTAKTETVEARFVNFDAPRRMVFKLVNEKGRWLIDGMTSDRDGNPDGYTLDQALKPIQ
jgi:hypothetical protein